jgi:phenol 2-monooxygenase (NADPH)
MLQTLTQNRIMAAAWAAIYRIKTILIDSRPNKTMNGHADGLQSRTIEILHSLGFGDKVYQEANRMQEVCFWVWSHQHRIFGGG